MFMLVVSFTVAFIVTDNYTINRIAEFDHDSELIFLTSHNEYIVNHNLANITDDTYRYEDYDNPNNINIKALVAYHKINNQIVFYSIYDFEHEKVLAYQTSNFYITTVAGIDYVGGIIPLVED